MTTPNPVEKIFITYKTRMTTEVRLRRTGVIFHTMLSWYSFCFIILSVLDATGKFIISYYSIASAVGATAIFGLSLFTYGERYNERANEFKNCYLTLQRLYESSMSAQRKMAEYAKIREQYENQSDSDYDNMLFDAYFRGQEIKNAHGVIQISTSTIISVGFRRFVRFAFISAVFVAPVLAATFWVQLAPVK